jgi:hypothetical protein
MNTTYFSPLKIVSAAILLIMLNIHNASAFTGYPSFGIKLVSAGNGLAAAPAITARYSFKRVDFDIGANFQLRESRFTGYQANMIYYVAPPSRKVRLGFFTGLRYFYSASLRQNVAAQEKWKQPEASVNFDELKMRCVEAQAGFGLRVHHSLRINSFYGIGFGAYHTLGNPVTYEGMHRELTQAELTLNFALSYSFR